jgi:hypothetical protein
MSEPRYFHVTEAGHNIYIRTFSETVDGVWCDACTDVHLGRPVDALSVPPEAHAAWSAADESGSQVASAGRDEAATA